VPKSDRRPPPAFQFYASDTLADEDFMFATMSERGLLISMMAYAWANGSVPRAPDLLARAIGSTEAEVNTAMTDRVLAQFRDCPTRPGFLEHPDLARQRREMEHRARVKTDAGKAGASGRWRKAKSEGGASTEVDSETSPMADAAQTQCERKAHAMRSQCSPEESRGEVRRGETNREEPACSRAREIHPEDEFVRSYEDAEKKLAAGDVVSALRPKVVLRTAQ